MLVIQFSGYVPSPMNDGTQVREIVLHNLYDDDDFRMSVSTIGFNYGDKIQYVQASGLHAHKILNRFNNIPFSHDSDSQTYRGEIARFIVENWTRK